MEDEPINYTILPPVTEKEMEMEFRFILRMVEAGHLSWQDVLNDDFWCNYADSSTTHFRAKSFSAE